MPDSKELTALVIDDEELLAQILCSAMNDHV